jgi:hypothetical protein
MCWWLKFYTRINICSYDFFLFLFWILTKSWLHWRLDSCLGCIVIFRKNYRPKLSIYLLNKFFVLWIPRLSCLRWILNLRLSCCIFWFRFLKILSVLYYYVYIRMLLRLVFIIRIRYLWLDSYRVILRLQVSEILLLFFTWISH